MVSSHARPDHVSRVTHDHTSVLELVETTWNLPAPTYRDLHAGSRLDPIDLTSPPAFLDPPTLAAPADPAFLTGCLSTGPGTIPPADYVTNGQLSPDGPRAVGNVDLAGSVYLTVEWCVGPGRPGSGAVQEGS